MNSATVSRIATVRLATELGEDLKRIELLPYHKFGTQTCTRLGREYALADAEPPSDDHVTRLRDIPESCGAGAQTGGQGLEEGVMLSD